MGKLEAILDIKKQRNLAEKTEALNAVKSLIVNTDLASILVLQTWILCFLVSYLKIDGSARLLLVVLSILEEFFQA